jgi:hypothetical protein
MLQSEFFHISVKKCTGLLRTVGRSHIGSNKGVDWSDAVQYEGAMWLRGKLGGSCSGCRWGGRCSWTILPNRMPLSLWIALCCTWPPFLYCGNCVLASSSIYPEVGNLLCSEMLQQLQHATQLNPERVTVVYQYWNCRQITSKIGLINTSLPGVRAINKYFFVCWSISVCVSIGGG